jgi:hypothetical protein
MRLRGERVILLALSVAVAANVWAMASGYLRPFHQHFLGLADKPAIERSAEISFGDRFTGYVLFLRSEIPPDATVIQPAFDADQTFGHRGLMQYFLFPRTVMACPVEITWASCMDRFAGPGTYVLAVGGFPPPFDPALGAVYISYQLGEGVFHLAAGKGAPQ